MLVIFLSVQITYDRKSIEAWLTARGLVSPSTGAPLRTADLTPNAIVRRLIARRHPTIPLQPWKAQG